MSECTVRKNTQRKDVRRCMCIPEDFIVMDEKVKSQV